MTLATKPTKRVKRNISELLNVEVIPSKMASDIEIIRIAGHPKITPQPTQGILAATKEIARYLKNNDNLFMALHIHNNNRDILI